LEFIVQRFLPGGYENNVVVIRNAGPNSYAPAYLLTLNDSYLCNVGDFDGDGLSEMVFASQSSVYEDHKVHIRVMESNSSHSYPDHFSANITTDLGSNISVVLCADTYDADIDNNGKKEIAVVADYLTNGTAPRNGSLLLYESTGNDTYTLKYTYDGVPLPPVIAKKYELNMPYGYKSFISQMEQEIKKRNGLLDRPINVHMIHAPKRNKILKCNIHNATISGETYTVLVGLLDEKPYEIFCGLSKQIVLPKKIKTGYIVKGDKKSGITTYDLKIPISDDDEMLFRDIVNTFDNSVYGAMTRTLSLSLRHGIPIQFIVEQLRKDKHGDIFSFSNVIARVLSKYIATGTTTR
jgi:hypothetical protein